MICWGIYPPLSPFHLHTEIVFSGIGYLGYDKYYNEEKYCDIECQDECDELIDLSNNINIFFLVDFIIICVTFGIIGLVLLRKYCCV